MHGITYFAPESRQAMDDLGFRGFWMGYFAARSAPLGQVPAPVVTATFYNFSPTRVAKALPAAWSIASPADALRTRLAFAVAALRRYGVTDDDHLRTAAELLHESGDCGARWTADRCSPQTRRCPGPTNPSTSSGTRRRCCASTAATGTLRRW